MNPQLRFVGVLQILAGLGVLGLLFLNLPWLLLFWPALLNPWPFIVSPIGALVGTLLLLCLLIALLALRGGWSLLDSRPVHRRTLKLVALLELPLFPLGTALGLYTFWVLARNPGPPQWQVLAARQRASRPLSFRRA